MISELTEEDWLSSGSSSNRPRSTSVCSVGVTSTRSAAFSVTVILVAGCAQFQADIEHDGNGRAYIDVLSVGLESPRCYGQMIRVERNVRNLKVSITTGLDLLHVLADWIFNAHFCAGHRGLGRIGDCALIIPFSCAPNLKGVARSNAATTAHKNKSPRTQPRLKRM